MPPTEMPQLHLSERYLQMAMEILRSHLPNAEVWAYGSRVNGDCYEASDLDLVVRQPDNLRHAQANYSDIIEAFSDSNLPIIVQLVDWARIPIEFQEEILANHALVQPGLATLHSFEKQDTA